MNFTRKAISFNIENNHQRDLFEWVIAQSGKNFSGYVKSVLYAHMVAGKGGVSSTACNQETSVFRVSEKVSDDTEAMNDIF
ncbi:hypothetical protein [Paenibacillus sp. Soil522]|uniref:hypothetical protein n=1 Tax=Paenibacillus sp. Soil522 TaxID=1736388 RepID=UPI0006FF2AE7|nr:hypothetical protein [Paenibacillus sp. Soil522]KRE35659.1 hypothetical protein ASG81_20695 [Paenibacillus sp. Soil522]